jgi:hypothetical protein
MFRLSTIEEQLQHVIEGRATHERTIAYSDLHGLWSGVTTTLSTSGAYEYLEYMRGASLPNVVRGTVVPARIQEVARLLLEIRAWEQHTPEARQYRTRVGRHSRCGLVMSRRRAGSGTTIWRRTPDSYRCGACWLASQLLWPRDRAQAPQLPHHQRCCFARSTARCSPARRSSSALIRSRHVSAAVRSP